MINLSLPRPLDEDILRDIIGAHRYNQAIEVFAADDVFDRKIISGTNIAAHVRDGHRIYNTVFIDKDKRLRLHCDCPDGAADICSHMDALLVTWLRVPKSFRAYKQAGITIDDFFTGTNPDPKHEYSRLLANLTIDEMRELAQRNDIALKGKRKREIIDTITAAFAQPATVQAACASLSPAARRLLTLFTLLEQDEGLRAYILDVYAQQLEHPPLTQNVTAFITELCQQGLLSRHDNFYTLPRLIADQLPPDTDFITAWSGTIDPHPQPPFALLRPALHLLLAAQTGALNTRSTPAPSPKPSRGRTAATIQVTAPLLTQATLQILSQITSAPKTQLTYLAHVLIDIGLLYAQPGQPLELNVTAFNRFSSNSPVEQTRQLLQATLTTTTWTELELAGDLVGEQIVLQPGVSSAAITALHNFLVQNRNFHFRMLHQLSAGDWVDFAAYRNLAWRLSSVGPTFERRRTRRNARSQEQQLHDAVVDAIFTGPWAWLGLVQLTYDSGQLTAFCLTEFGEHLLGHRPHYTPPVVTPEAGQPALNIAPDGSLQLYTAQAHPPLLNLLSLLADAPQFDAAGTLRYQPTARGAAHCFAAGWTPDTITEQLQTAAHTSLPPTLTQHLATWWDNFGRLHLYTDIALIEFSDDYALAELLASTTLAQHLLYRFSPRLAAIKSESVKHLIDELNQHGYTPKLAEVAHRGEA